MGKRFLKIYDNQWKDPKSGEFFRKCEEYGFTEIAVKGAIVTLAQAMFQNGSITLRVAQQALFGQIEKQSGDKMTVQDFLNIAVECGVFGKEEWEGYDVFTYSMVTDAIEAIEKASEQGRISANRRWKRTTPEKAPKNPPSPNNKTLPQIPENCKERNEFFCKLAGYQGPQDFDGSPNKSTIDESNREAVERFKSIKGDLESNPQNLAKYL